MTKRSDGFTLVELLIALSLVAMLSVMLFEGLRSGARTVTTAGARIDRASEIATAYGFLQKAIGDAQLLPTGTQAGDAQARFTGSREELDFVTTPPAQLALGGFHRLHLGLEPGDGGRRLSVAWQLLSRFVPESGADELAPSVLVDKVAALEFAYLARPQQDSPPEWRDDWDSATELPALVRLRITLTDGWQTPDLIVAPRLTTRAGP